MGEISKVSALYPLMYTELTGDCPEPLMLQHLQSALRLFCNRTKAWIETLPSIDLVEDQDDYALVSTWTARVDQVREVRINTEDGVDAGLKGSKLDEASWDYDPSTEKVTLAQAPTADVTDGLEVDVAIVPELYVDNVASWFMNRYAEDIVAGAMVTLLRMPDKDWSKAPETGALIARYEKSWLGGIGRAKSAKAKGYKRIIPSLSA